MKMTASLSKDVGVKRACHALTVSRAGFYRWRNLSENEKPASVRALPPLALSREEQQRVLDALHEERFVDKAPQEVYASLLDEGAYLCSVRTMYRILEAHQEVKERRNQLRHPVYTKPELLAQGPNQCQCRFKMSSFCRNKMSPDCRFHSERFSGSGCSSSTFGEGPNMPAFRFSLSL